MRGGKSRLGGSSTTRSVRTAVWGTGHRKSLRRHRLQASPQLSERKATTKKPQPNPRPPPRLKPEMEPQKVVVFLHERRQGAGQFGTCSTRPKDHSCPKFIEVRYEIR